MSRKHSKVEQLDGITDNISLEDEEYAGSKHYWASGWLCGAYLSFVDANATVEKSDISEEEKKMEKMKVLEARKTALSSSFADFPPWSKA